MAGRVISPDLEREVLAHAAAGWSTRRIAEWCKTERGVEASHNAVARLLAKTSETRGAVAAAVTREALRPHIVDDLTRLGEIREEVAERRRRAAEREDMTHTEFARLAQLEAELCEKRLKFAGATEQPDAKPLVSEDDIRRMAEVVLGS